jgi:hypothetical protein
VKFGGVLFLAAMVSLQAQDTASANIDEAFRLAGVRTLLSSLPSHVNEMTAAALGQLPSDQRLQFGPLINDVSLKFLDPDAFARQLKTYFASHYNTSKMATFLALERTPAYRSMHRMEAASEAAGIAVRRNFEASLKTDPPTPKRVAILQRLDEAMQTTDLQVKIVAGILNAMSAGMGARMPTDLDAQTAAFTAKIRPILAGNVLIHNLFVYRNADDTDLEDYIEGLQQSSVVWFNRTLHDAILAVAADRASRAGEYIKSKLTRPFN